ncbi:unnamed protein product [Thelazia callipaeda]|uniref:Phospholipid scramblase n=1 Tax=Thelazia callipaeda TaxID=103827 RepID=A0A0N5D7C7_THECL|nr:unnamed protein product [Thelazia callipaeda]
MGRSLTKNDQARAQSAYLLRKVHGRGIMKQLTATEKRRRMIEAGSKYAALNRENAPVKCSRSVNCASAASNMKDNVVVTATSSANDKMKFRNAATPTLSTINETFVRDDAALKSILNKCMPCSFTRRASIYRNRERPSLFPNGINPLDVAAAKFAKSGSLGSCDTRLLTSAPISSREKDVSMSATLCSVMGGLKKTPLSLLPDIIFFYWLIKIEVVQGKTVVDYTVAIFQGKTVRFDESISFQSPKNCTQTFPEHVDKTSFESTDKVILDLTQNFDDMLKKIRGLSACVFNNLAKAVHQVAVEKSMMPCEGHKILSDSSDVSTLNDKNCLMSEKCTTDLKQDCIALKTTRMK